MRKTKWSSRQWGEFTHTTRPTVKWLKSLPWRKMTVEEKARSKEMWAAHLSLPSTKAFVKAHKALHEALMVGGNFPVEELKAYVEVMNEGPLPIGESEPVELLELVLDWYRSIRQQFNLQKKRRFLYRLGSMCKK